MPHQIIDKTVGKPTYPGMNKWKKQMNANLIAVKNLIYQHHVTYNSLDEMFIVHQEEHGKHNMHFRMHERGLH